MNKPTKSLIDTKMDNITPNSPSNKPFDSQAIYQETLTDMIKTAKKKGWKEWTWHEVLRLNEDNSGLFTGIKDDFLKVMQNEKKGKT
jgi:hypothetical protein